MRELAAFFLLFGAAFSALGALGLLRARDTRSRLHLVGLLSTFGAGGALVGSFLYHGGGWQELVVALFLVLSTPAGSHALARALAKRSGKLPEWSSSEDC